MLLLKGGTVLTLDKNDHVVPIKADLLIKGKRIEKIAEQISPPTPETRVLDCVDKIISPGFIDTHRHMWQTLLKGRHANETLLEYMYSGNLQSSNHDASDIFWAQLAGCMESIDVGTTTFVDHSHANVTPDHSKAALAATVSSGLRSIFCYTPTIRVNSWNPLTLNYNMLEDWVQNTLTELAKEAPFGNGLVTLGLGADLIHGLSKDQISSFFGNAKSLGIKLITLHYVRSLWMGTSSLVTKLQENNLLDSSILLSHASGADQKDAELIRKHNTHVSVTPSTELQMGHGNPVALNPDLDIQNHCSLGIDCHSNNSSSIIGEMRLLLQSSRAIRHKKFAEQGKCALSVGNTVEDVFNLGTIGGARSIGMESEIGSLQEGKLADLVLFDACSPSMVCAAQQDPVAAIVLHSSQADIEVVVVDGEILKGEGKLRDVRVGGAAEKWDGGREILKWRDVAGEVVKRREVLQGKIEGIDMVEARESFLKGFRVDESIFVD